ncbi:unnamed protein product [Phyllotreta striolata]|uniref:Apolipophorins n=1 Tax=Phyllotreta striolata TaxID=444603 RepID=A0A9N9TFE7_PHYSR|nr:unnamed protein product [Phyllotreta striolata]
MGRRGPIRWGLALFALVLVSQRTLADHKCKTGCKGSSHTFKYAPGTTYKYNYEGKIDISLSSAEGQLSSTDVKATVLLTQQTDCNQLLRLQNVHVTTSNGKKLGHIPDVEKPVQLNFQDGRLEDSICADPADTQNSLNIKRAIASLFQADLKGGHETDIFGVCPTEVVQHHEGSDLVVQKSRDLNKCAYREHLRQDFFATTFNVNSEIKSSPILNGDYNAKLRIKNGILNQAQVVETYLYVPFSVGKNGARAEIVSKLHYVSSSKDNHKAAVSAPKSIIFDNPHPVVAQTSNVHGIMNAVNNVVKTIDVVVGEHTAREFITLIKTVRASKKDDLLSVYNQVRSGIGISDKEVGKKVFLDALLQAGEGDAVEVALTLLKTHQFNDDEKKLVYISLSLIRHTSKGAINSAAQLLSLHDLPEEAYLGIGNLVGRYCRQHSCDNVDAVNQITTKLAAKLSNSKTTDKKVENEIILILKTLGNFGHINDNIVQKIIDIAKNKQVSDRLRAVALETYLSDPCKDKLRNSALAILQDIQQDSEIRIKAYLALAKCPNAKIGNAVKAMLEKEPSFQVGGFITSHIRNVKASANPDKHLAKQFLNFNVPKKFPVDFRKWSYNGEVSYAVDTLGLAASTEANIIYSQESFLPRSTSLNVSAEVFGHSFNFLELNTRQENLDKLVEHYFGPKGVLRSASLRELLKNNDQVPAKLWEQLNSKLSASLRARRDVSRHEIDTIGKAVHIKENVLNTDLDLDISVKAFGSEVLYKNLNIFQRGLTAESVIDNIVKKFNEGLDKLKKFQEVFRTNILFLDAELDYPTSLGFPLRLAVEGTSNTQVKAEGGLDVRALLHNKDTNINIKLIPSASIEVTGRLTLDALVVENGLKVVSTLYTATGGDLKINLQNELKGVDVKFGLPVQVQKLISANHEIVFETREAAGVAAVTPLKFAQVKDFSVCLDNLVPFVGLAFCAVLNGPNLAGKQVPVLPFPLAGDSKISVSIENEDLKEYHVKAVNKDFSSVDLVVETIGKNGKKKLSLELQGEVHPQKFIKAALTSPIKNVFVEGRLTNTDHEKSLLLKAGEDNAQSYIKLGVGIAGSANKQEYSPILEYKTPSGNQQLPVHVDGKIILEKRGDTRTIVFDNLKVHLPNDKVIGVNGKVGEESPFDLFTDLTISEGKNSGSINGKYHLDKNSLKINTEVKNTLNPTFNIHLKGETKRSEDLTHFDSNWQVIHGQDLSSKTNILTLTNSFTRKFKNPNDFTFATKNKLTYPALGVHLQGDYEQTPNSVDYDLNLQYNDIKFSSELEAFINQKTHGDFDVEFQISGLENKVEFKASREVQGNEKSKINNELILNGLKLAVKGLITHNIKPSNVDVGADLTVILPTHPTPFKVDSFLRYNINELDVSHKVTSGNQVVIDVFLKANKNGNANGSAKIHVKNILEVTGQLKAVKGHGSGHLQVDALTIKKQLRLESTFDIQPASVYHVSLTLYPNYGEDKNQKLVVTTNTKLGAGSLDSKNSLDLLGKVLQVNLKGNKNHNDQNGKHGGEIEVILPTDQYLLGKAHGDYARTGDGAYDGNDFASLEYRKNKNNAGRKLSLTTKYKNVKPEAGLYDVSYTLSADDANGNNINSDLTFKVQKPGDKRDIAISNKIYGSVLKEPIESGLHFSYLKGSGDYKVTYSYGQKAVSNIGGKYDVRGGEHPILGEWEIDLKLPSQTLKTLKSKVSGSVLLPREANEHLKITGAATVYAENGSDTLVDFSSDGHVRASDKDGELKGSLKSTKLGPVSVAAGYSRKEEGPKKQYNANLGLKYGKDKNIKIDSTLIRPNENEYKLDAEIETPLDNFKKNNLKVTTKRSEDGKHVTSKVALTHDGHLATLDSELKLSEIAPLIDIKFKCPQTKAFEFHLDGNRVSDKEFAFNYKLLCEKNDFLLEGSLDANLADADSFHIKGDVNSPKLKLDKITFEANNKPAKAGKRIQIHVKSNGKNLVTGSTSYSTHEEHGKYTIEGSGSLKIKDETKAANFKYTSQQLTQEKNGEQGFEVIFDAGVGDDAIDAELKVTNKQFRISESFCEKTKECAHFEYDSKVNHNELDKYNHVLEITVDLRKLGIPNEFGLKSVTNRENYVLDHTVDVHFQSPENSKYQYSVYLHPDEAGVSLTTPKRVVALEGHVKGPRNVKQAGGKVSAELAFYLDKKNNPNQKAGVSAWISADPHQSKGLLNGEVKFTHPGLQRPLSVSLHSTESGDFPNKHGSISLTIDIFAQPNQKIVAEYKVLPKANQDNGHYSIEAVLDVKSSGLGIDFRASQDLTIDKGSYSGEYNGRVKYDVGKSKYDNQLVVRGGKKGSHLLVKLMNINLLKIDSKYHISKDEQTVESEVSTFDNKPVVHHWEVKKFNTITYSVSFKDTPKEKVVVHAGLIPGQVADVRADHVTGSGKINLFQASLKLDDSHFLQPDYNINSKEIEVVLDKSRAQVQKLLKGLESVGKDINSDIRREASQLTEITKKAAPNLEPLKKYYVSEIQKIKDEILQDKSLQELGELVKTIIFSLADLGSTIVVQAANVLQAVAVAVQKVALGVIESLEKHLIPAFREVADRFANIVGDIINTTVDILATILGTISHVFEKYQPEIKQLVATFGEFSHDIGRFIQKAYEQVRKIVSNLYKKIGDELKGIPVFEELKAQWDDLVKDGLPNAEGLLGGLKEIAATIKDLIPMEIPIQEEISQLIDLTVDYLEKKIKGQPVDDIAVLDKYISIYANLGRKILAIVTSTTADMQQPQIPISLDFLRKLPKLVAIKFSPIDYLLKEDPTRDVVKFGLSLLNNPRQWVPPFPLFASAGNSHIFTFDGKYINFPANCKYLLARDAVNGNFTIVGTWANGRLTAITVADAHDSITYNSNAKATLNNAHADLPIHKSDLQLFREYDSVTFKSAAGLEVVCDINLIGCTFFVSGFYHAQAKGLLGLGNNEPYDDFTVPNGKIVTSESDFGNSYKIGNCQPVAAPKPAGKSAECDKVFGWESSLKLCYPFVDVENYKTACAQGLAAKEADTEYLTAAAYALSCWNHNIPVSLPAHLMKCTNGQEERKIGSQFSVKLPAKAADIVLIIDTAKVNEPLYHDLIKPLVQEVTKGLGAKGIHDVEYHLITYGGDSKWPGHVTVGGKFTFKGNKIPEIKFADKPKRDEKNMGWHLFDSAVRDLELAFGQDLQSKTYTEAYEYPFRAHATRTFIVLTSKPCEVGKLYPLQKLRTLLFKNNLISLTLVTPVENFGVKDPAKTKEIIGFNDEQVYTASHGKTKKAESSAELYKELFYNDYCIDFTLKSRGNVFVSNNFLAGNDEVKKQFIHVASHNTIEEIVSLEQGLDCECKQVSPFTASNVCWETYSKEKSSPKKGGVKA